MSTTPAALTAGIVTRLAKAAAPGVRFSSTKIAPGTVRAVVLSELGRPYDEAAEVRYLNNARNAMIREGYDASVGRVGSHGYLLTVVEPEPTETADADAAPFVDVVARHGRPAYLACAADGTVVGEYRTRTEATRHLPAPEVAATELEAPASVLDGLDPADRAHLVTVAAARAVGLFIVQTDDGAVGMYPTPEQADGVAEGYRAAGTGASVLRPCGHTWNRYAPSVHCQECASLRSLRDLRTIGGHLNPSNRARLEAADLFAARLDATDAEAPAAVVELEQQLGDRIASSPALAAWVARRRETVATWRSAAEVLADREPSAARPQVVLPPAAPSIPTEGEVAAVRQGVTLSPHATSTALPADAYVGAMHLEPAAAPLTPTAVQGLTAAGEAIAAPSTESSRLGPVEELALYARVSASLGAAPEASGAARHCLAVLRGAEAGHLQIIGYTEEGVPQVRYSQQRGGRTVFANAESAYEELEAAGYVVHDAGAIRLTRRGRKLLETMPPLRAADWQTDAPTASR